MKTVKTMKLFFFVIPAKAGIQFFRSMGVSPMFFLFCVFLFFVIPAKAGIQFFVFLLSKEPIAKLFENVAQSPSAVSNLLYFQCFSYYLPSRGRLGYSFAIGSKKTKNLQVLHELHGAIRLCIFCGTF